MSKISDIIEQFILSTLGDDSFVDISRNELANFFSCAPSQINYVLETRFTTDRGFIKESQRGGGGYIKITRVPLESEDNVDKLIMDSVGAELSYKRADHILDKFMTEKIITSREKGLILSAVSDNALSMPLAIRDTIRANMFKQIILYLLKEKEHKEKN